MERQVAKVVIAKQRAKTAGEIRLEGTSVGRKRVRNPDGQLKEMRTLDAASRTFSADLTYVFGKNVTAARRENKRVTGVADVAPAKG